MENVSKFDIYLHNEDVFDVGMEDSTFDMELIDRGVGSTVKDYDKLINKPQINGVELEGNKSYADLGIGIVSTQDIIDIVDDAYNQIFN